MAINYGYILTEVIAEINAMPKINGAHDFVCFLERDEVNKTLTLYGGVSNHRYEVLLKEKITSNHEFNELYKVFVHKLIMMGIFGINRLVNDKKSI